MSCVIDLSRFDRFDIEGVPKTTDLEILRESNSVVTIESKVTKNNFLKFLIPGPLVPGTKVTFICETQHVDGDKIQLSLDSYSSGNYSSGKTIESAVDGDSSGDFVESRVNMFVKPGKQYVRCVLGYFSARIGKAKVRAARVEISGTDISTVKPEVSQPTGFSKTFTAAQMNEQWSDFVDGTGTIDRQPDKITLTADYTSRAFIRYAAGGSMESRSNNAVFLVEESGGFFVDVKSVRRSGFPGVYVDYYDNTTIKAVLRGFLIGIDDEYQRFWFPPYPGSDRAFISIGLFTNSEGDCDIKAVRITQIGGYNQSNANQMVPICAAIKKGSGSWYINSDSVSDGAHRFAKASVDSITVNTNNITVNFAADSVKGYKPHIMAAIDESNGHAATYYAATSFANNNSVILTIYNRSTRTIVPTASVLDGTFVTLMGFGIR